MTSSQENPEYLGQPDSMTGEQVLELKMAPWVKALTAKPAHLSSIPGPTRGIESNNHACMLSSYLQIHTWTCACAHSHSLIYNAYTLIHNANTPVHNAHTHNATHSLTNTQYTHNAHTHLHHAHTLIHNAHTLICNVHTQCTHIYVTCTHTMHTYLHTMHTHKMILF